MKSIVKIGCDPAFRKNGFSIAILDENNELHFKTFKKPINFIGWVMFDMPTNSHVAVENSNLQESTFDMRGTKAVVAKKSRNVGKNQAISQIAYEMFNERALKVLNISPKRKGAKWTDDGVMCGLIRSYNIKAEKRKFSQDERDAFKLLMMI